MTRPKGPHPHRDTPTGHPARPDTGLAMDRREFLAAGVLAATSLSLAPVPVQGEERPPRFSIPQKPLDPQDLACREDLAG